LTALAGPGLLALRVFHVDHPAAVVHPIPPVTILLGAGHGVLDYETYIAALIRGVRLLSPEPS
jgi:hypothetical protein